jgi:hypothetical protein
MMALALLDTKSAGVIQPDPGSANPARLKPSTYWPRPTDRAAPSFRLRVYTATELARLIEDVGFAEIELANSPSSKIPLATRSSCSICPRDVM